MTLTPWDDLAEALLLTRLRLRQNGRKCQIMVVVKFLGKGGGNGFTEAIKFIEMLELRSFTAVVRINDIALGTN